MQCAHSWKRLEGDGDADQGNYLRECTKCGMVERYTYWTEDDGSIKTNRTILEGPKQEDIC